VRFLLRFPIAVALVVPDVGILIWVVGTGFVLQFVLDFAGAVTFAVTHGRTLSDVVTNTRVVYRSVRPDSSGS
jgi:hypothetical protein